MRHTGLIRFILLTLLLSSLGGGALSGASHRLLLQLPSGLSFHEWALDQPFPITRLKRIASLNWEVIQIESAITVSALCELLEQSSAAVHAEPDRLIRTSAISPNDPDFISERQWNLSNEGQNGGIPDADIDAPEAWEIIKEAPEVIVAIIDTGMRITHEDLQPNLWVNAGEIPLNGLDDDDNGYVDDSHGINAIDQSGNPIDENGHGTHIAGIVGAVGNNAKGIAGVAWKVRLMALRFQDAEGYGFLSDGIECMEYARLQGAKIWNISWGEDQYSEALAQAVSAAEASGVLLCVACDNQGRDLDRTPMFPACLTNKNVLVTAALTRRGEMDSYSNFGATSVDLSAPGTDVWSTWHTSDSAYRSLSGTSMAAPHLAGAAALIAAKFHNEGYLDWRKRLITSTAEVLNSRGRTVTGGTLNLHEALRIPSRRSYLIQDTEFNWVDPTAHSPVMLGSNLTSEVSLPFEFKFYDATYNKFFITQQGFVSFLLPDDLTRGEDRLPSPRHPNGAIYALWSDYLQILGQVRHAIVGEAPSRRVVISWLNLLHLTRDAGPPTLSTFQMILEESSGDIVLQYLQTSPAASEGGGRNATVGIEDPTGQSAEVFSHNGLPEPLANHQAVRFIPLPPQPARAARLESTRVPEGIRIRIYGEIGRSYTLEGGLDLRNWTGLKSFTIPDLGFVDSNQTGPEIFFRAKGN